MVFLLYNTAKDDDGLIDFLRQHRNKLDPFPPISVISVSLYRHFQEKLALRTIETHFFLAQHRSWTFNPRYTTYWT